MSESKGDKLQAALAEYDVATLAVVAKLQGDGFRVFPPPSAGLEPSLLKAQREDPGRAYCPHCGAWKPAYGILPGAAAIPGMAALTYLTVVCNECRAIVAMLLTGFEPDAEMIAKFQQAIGGAGRSRN